MKKWIFIIVIAGGFLHWYTKDPSISKAGLSPANPKYTTVIEEVTSLNEADVILYATDWCGYCKKTRTLLDNKDIEYVEYNIEQSSYGRQQYERLDGSGVPLLIVKPAIIRGYNPRAINTALNNQ